MVRDLDTNAQMKIVTRFSRRGLRQARCISCVLSQWMRVIFLTLHVDNLPETGKRQYENKQDANLTRRHGVDCTTIRPEKICAVIFPPNEMRHAFRCGATSEELIELSEVAGSERIAGSSYRACCCFTAKGRP